MVLGKMIFFILYDSRSENLHLPKDPYVIRYRMKLNYRGENYRKGSHPSATVNFRACFPGLSHQSDKGEGANEHSTQRGTAAPVLSYQQSPGLSPKGLRGGMQRRLDLV